MPIFRPYLPEQAELLPRDVRTELGEEHLCFLIHEIVESWDIGEFIAAYSEQGGETAYHPRMMLKVLLYGFAVKVKSTRKLEQRTKEDLAFRYLAANAHPDHKTINLFYRRHEQAIRNLFVQALGMVRAAGMARLGLVAIDSTRIKANASREKRILRRRDLEKVLEWEKNLEQDSDGMPGMSVSAEDKQRLREQLQRLQDAGESKLSETDPDARFVRDSQGGFLLGYTAEVAVTEDHFIAAVNVSQSKSDNHALVPMVEQLEQHYQQPPESVLADAGFFSKSNLEEMEKRGIDAYIPDSNMAKEIKHGATADQQKPTSDPRMLGMRKKLRTPEGRERYRKRKSLVEPVFGTLKEQRGMRQFQRRGLAKVTVEFTLAALAFNLTRLHSLRRLGREV